MNLSQLKLSAILCLIVSTASAQDLEIWRVEQEGQQVNIYYDLADKNGSQKYSVYLYSSIDGFTKPLTSVTGHINENVLPEKNKKAVWNMTREFGSTFGLNAERISFELRAEPFKPFASMFETYTQLRRGRTYPLNWVTNRGEGLTYVDLLRQGELVSRVAATTDNYHELVLSRKLKLGAYQVRLVKQNDETLSVTSDSFNVRAKVPLIIKMAPLAIVGIVVAVLGRPKPSPSGGKLPDPALPD